MPIVCDMKEFPVGTHVNVTRTIKWGQCPYLWVLHKADIKKAPEQTIKNIEVIKGSKLFERKLESDDN